MHSNKPVLGLPFKARKIIEGIVNVFLPTTLHHYTFYKLCQYKLVMKRQESSLILKLKNYSYSHKYSTF